MKIQNSRSLQWISIDKIQHRLKFLNIYLLSINLSIIQVSCNPIFIVYKNYLTFNKDVSYVLKHLFSFTWNLKLTKKSTMMFSILVYILILYWYIYISMHVPSLYSGVVVIVGGGFFGWGCIVVVWSLNIQLPMQ